MTQRIRRGYDLPLDPAALVERLRDRTLVERRSAVDGLGTRVAAHEPTAAGVRIVVATDLPVDWLPAIVRGRLTADPTVERTEEWAVEGDGAATPLTFVFAGMPVRGSGDARLVPLPTGSRLDVEVDITVDVPLVGALVEAAVAPRIVAALDAEAAFYGTLPLPASPGSVPP